MEICSNVDYHAQTSFSSTPKSSYFRCSRNWICKYSQSIVHEWQTGVRAAGHLIRSDPWKEQQQWWWWQIQVLGRNPFLTKILHLYRSHNSLTCLPDAIGSLQQLQLLNVAHNRLTEIPDTICHLARLTDLDVSHNNIRELTPFIGHLKKLRTLNASANQLDCLPVQIGGLVNLAALCVSHNSQLRNLPAEIMQLPYLRNISFSNCPLSQTQSLKHDPPSLFEICARVAVTQLNWAGEHRNIPEHLVKYLDTAKPCTACGQPYFKEYVSRLRLAEKSENIVPIEYRLCSAHWSDDNDRVLYMFARPPASNIVRDYPRRLPSLDNSVATHRAHLQISSSSTSNSVGGQQQEDSNKALWKPQRFIKVMNRNCSGFLSSKGW